MTREEPFQPIDIVILSNGPGELTTWVRPIVKALRQQLGEDREYVRLSLVLSPCPNASGREVAIAQTYLEIDRIQGAEHFFPFLFWGKTSARWDWRDRGIVLFLGGDQFYTVVIGKRLGYQTVIYGEWETRWHNWIDRFGVMKPELIKQVNPKYAHKFTVVGDLMAEVGSGEWAVGNGQWEENSGDEAGGECKTELIGLLPGSKPAKLVQGMPLSLAIAHHIYAARPQTRFVIPVAPTLNLINLIRFIDPQQNPLVHQFGLAGTDFIPDPAQPYLKTAEGLRIDLWTVSPAYELLSQCRLCLTTVGANTAELGALAVPMIVLLPTQQLDAMRAWDGIPGLLANLPGIGTTFAKLINWWFLRKSRLLAWPNIWAGEAIVPELVGKLQPRQVAEVALNLLNHPKKLEQMRNRLHEVRGQPGAAKKLAYLVTELIVSS